MEKQFFRIISKYSIKTKKNKYIEIYYRDMLESISTFFFKNKIP